MQEIATLIWFIIIGILFVIAKPERKPDSYYKQWNEMMEIINDKSVCPATNCNCRNGAVVIETK